MENINVESIFKELELTKVSRTNFNLHKLRKMSEFLIRKYYNKEIIRRPMFTDKTNTSLLSNTWVLYVSKCVSGASASKPEYSQSILQVPWMYECPLNVFN